MSTTLSLNMTGYLPLARTCKHRAMGVLHDVLLLMFTRIEPEHTRRHSATASHGDAVSASNTWSQPDLEIWPISSVASNVEMTFV